MVQLYFNMGITYMYSRPTEDTYIKTTVNILSLAHIEEITCNSYNLSCIFLEWVASMLIQLIKESPRLEYCTALDHYSEDPIVGCFLQTARHAYQGLENPASYSEPYVYQRETAVAKQML